VQTAPSIYDKPAWRGSELAESQRIRAESPSYNNRECRLVGSRAPILGMASINFLNASTLRRKVVIEHPAGAAGTAKREPTSPSPAGRVNDPEIKPVAITELMERQVSNCDREETIG
jgi:hypothetical protein